jgi:hypothetical protein
MLIYGIGLAGSAEPAEPLSEEESLEIVVGQVGVDGSRLAGQKGQQTEKLVESTGFHMTTTFKVFLVFCILFGCYTFATSR